MSEFACRNGHPMYSGQWTCSECGAPLATMDGKGNAELLAEERAADRRAEADDIRRKIITEEDL